MQEFVKMKNPNVFFQTQIESAPKNKADQKYWSKVLYKTVNFLNIFSQTEA